jgi:predicted lactoylglutathione lyase
MQIRRELRYGPFIAAIRRRLDGGRHRERNAERKIAEACRFQIASFDVFVKRGNDPQFHTSHSRELSVSTTIFVSLPVQDLPRSMQFYESLGYQPNPQFTDETVACFAVSDTINLMLATSDKFKQLTTKEIADPTKVCHALLSLSCESREAVDSIVAKAIAAGGSKAHDPEDYGFMYQYGFYDLDGHGWGVFWMDPAGVPQEGQS